MVDTGGWPQAAQTRRTKEHAVSDERVGADAGTDIEGGAAAGQRW